MIVAGDVLRIGKLVWDAADGALLGLCWEHPGDQILLGFAVWEVGGQVGVMVWGVGGREVYGKSCTGCPRKATGNISVGLRCVCVCKTPRGRRRL